MLLSLDLIETPFNITHWIHHMSLPPADRKAIRRNAVVIDPAEQRRRIGELLATLPPDARIAADVAALWPRLIHQLARRGELSAPSFSRAL